MIFINAVESYQLWYDGAGYHDISAVADAQLMGRLAETATNRAVAEWALRQLDYANDRQRKIQNFKNQNHELQSTRTADYISHIHAACQADIESRWGERLDDKTVGEILFEDKLLKELEKIKPKNTDINIQVG